jgi:arylsulfatase
VVANPLAGKSLLPLLFAEQKEVDRQQPLFWERAGNRAVRLGKWKLVSTWPGYNWELYDLDNDRGETKNVARQNHDIVSKLSVAYFDWAKKTGVVDFATLEAKEPASMKEFRKSKVQEQAGESYGF